MPENKDVSLLDRVENACSKQKIQPEPGISVQTESKVVILPDGWEIACTEIITFIRREEQDEQEG